MKKPILFAINKCGMVYSGVEPLRNPTRWRGSRNKTFVPDRPYLFASVKSLVSSGEYTTR